MQQFTIRQGNCLDILKTFPSNSIDAVVTDPPYGISFMNRKWDYDVPSVESWKECLRVLKPGGHLLSFAGTRTQHRMCCNIEDAGFEIRDMIAWIYGQGFPKSMNISKAIAKAEGDKLASDALKWTGWGTSLKPALEPITVARKPLDGTVVENVLLHGVGGLNIDACRIDFLDEADKASAFPGGKLTSLGAGSLAGPSQAQTAERSDFVAEQSFGRFPANLIIDDSTEVAEGFPVQPRQQSPKQINTNRAGESSKDNINQGKVGFAMKPGIRRETVSANRFFYCAKATKADRGDGNEHPTVKPTDLMRYLCRLVTPPQGIILDPFCGSGSTGKAALLEGFRFVGIEIEEETVKTAKSRLQTTLDDQRGTKGVGVLDDILD